MSVDYRYYIHNNNKLVRRGHQTYEACFSLFYGMHQPGHSFGPFDRVTYPCPSSLSKPMIEDYIAFLYAIFGRDRMQLRLITRNKKNWVIMRLRVYPNNYRKNLVYWTAVRYMQEFTHHVEPFIKILREMEDKSPDAQFRAFHKYHHDHSGMDNGHGLVARYMARSHEVISLEDFRKNLANPDLRTVYDHFYPPVRKK